MDCIVILIPHPNDSLGLGVFPQPPFFSNSMNIQKARSAHGLDDSVLLFSNPCSFSVDEVVYTVSSIDSIKELSANEVSNQCTSKTSIKGNRIVSLFQHILEQSSFNPVSPSNIIQSIPDLKIGPTDLLISPSLLKPSVGMVGEVVVLNPGKLNGGWFSRICIHPLEFEEFSDDAFEHHVGERCRIEISKF